MARKPNVNDLLTKRLLPPLLGVMDKASRYPDRLTRDEAKAVYAWGRNNPEVMAALRDHTHPAHASVALYKDVVEHYIFKHPADAQGVPQPWPDRPPSTHRPTEADPFAGMTRDEAEALMTWAETEPEYREALTDPKHPQHQLYVDQVAGLHRITSEGSPSPETGEPVATPAGDQTAVQALQADQAFMGAYMDKRNPGHAAAVERMAAAYKLAHPEPVEVPLADRLGADRGQGVVTAEHGRRVQADAQALGRVQGIRPDGRVFEVEVARLRADPAYANKTDPRHGEAVQAVTAAYQAAFPEPAQGGDDAA